MKIASIVLKVAAVGLFLGSAVLAYNKVFDDAGIIFLFGVSLLCYGCIFGLFTDDASKTPAVVTPSPEPEPEPDPLFGIFSREVHRGALRAELSRLEQEIFDASTRDSH